MGVSKGRKFAPMDTETLGITAAEKRLRKQNARADNTPLMTGGEPSQAESTGGANHQGNKRPKTGVQQSE